MKNSITVSNVDGELLEIELLVGFKVEGIGKEYIAYTINDDDMREEVEVFISEVSYENEVPKVVPIKEDEKEMVLMFYSSLRSSI